MNENFRGWQEVANRLKRRANESVREDRLNRGQRASLLAIADRIVSNGVLIADEVGMGKTRIAVEVARAVKDLGGRVAILAPPGLGYQWQAELRDGGIPLDRGIVRSLDGYLSAWAEDGEDQQKPWFDEALVMISHRFGIFYLGEKSQSWRWSLLPELYAHWCKSKRNGRWPRFYNENNWSGYRSNRAASSITAAIRENLKSDSIPWKFLNGLADMPNWKEMLDPAEYGTNRAWRDQFEQGVGLGFGLFDLIIIDEAHKSRGKDSGLWRLLDNVILPAESARRLALTATPIELNVEQWTETLRRLGLDDQELSRIQERCAKYADAVTSVRDNWPAVSDETYKKASGQFQKVLSPYLIRRDKREDAHVQKFQEHSKESIQAYRRETEVRVEVAGLDDSWRMGVCGAEALSFVAAQRTDLQAKRLRLTLGNGHGLANWLDQQERVEADSLQERHDEEAAKKRGESLEEIRAANADDERRILRAQWWKNVIGRAFNQTAASLYNHPAILKAVETIEKETDAGEKVLVFGRFTKPMQALVSLLNARAMLLRVDRGLPWPESKIQEEDQPAVDAAFSQLNRQKRIRGLESLDALKSALKQKYDADRRNRERFRVGMVDGIKKGFERSRPSKRVQALFHAFKNSVHGENAGHDEGDLAVVARALMESMKTIEDHDYEELAAAFGQLIEALSDRDAMEDGEDERADETVEADWQEIVERLREEFTKVRGRFARFMYGETSQHSRRMIQLAFNRQHSFPRVLVAQSMVGREGLNLHEACRIVVLLHPEWNPGVVEQQIGRVDRVGSHWSKKLDQAIEEKRPVDELPRIEVRPIIFSGTYDEHNWKVLKNRWDTLRSQLHGIVIPEKEVGENPESRERWQEINKAAPCFSPETCTTAEK